MKKDNTLLELVTGIILVGVAVQIVCLIAFRTICIMRLDCGVEWHWKRNGDSYEALHRRCIGSWRDRRGKTCQNDVCTEDNGSFDFDGMRTLF